MRKGFLTMLLTISVGSGWSSGQSYYPHPYYQMPAPQYGPQLRTPNGYVAPPYRVPSNAPRPMHYYPAVGMHPAYNTGVLPQYRPVVPVYPARPPSFQSTPVSAPQVLSNPQSPPITILPENEPLPPDNTALPQTPIQQELPNTIPLYQQPPAVSEGSGFEQGQLPPFVEGQNRQTIEPPKSSDLPEENDSLLPGAPILYGDKPGEKGLDCEPPCLPACPLLAPPAAPPVFQGPAIAPPGFRFFGNAGFLLWWARQQNSPVLLNVGGIGGPIIQSIGPGNLQFDNQQRMGIRSTLGFWLTPDQKLGVEATGFALFDRSPVFATFSDGITALTRPITLADGSPASAVVAAPGVFNGGTIIEAFHRLWGVETNLRANLLRGQSWFVDAIAGFRYLELDERLNVETNTNALATGNNLFISDRFGTRNKYAAGQIGLQGEAQFSRIFVNGYGKFAFGRNRQIVHIEGRRTVTPAGGAPVTTANGILAQPSNNGRHANNQFSFLPEFGMNIGFTLTDSIRVSTGYTFLYLTNVARPGSHMNTTVNLGQPVGPAVPIFSAINEDYWAQGINFTIEFRY